MSGVYISGIKMPKNCWDCPCADKQYGSCEILHEPIWDNRLAACPLVPVLNHGRLIDADALKDNEIIFNHDEWDDVFDDGLLFVMDQVDNAPTIIPADKEVDDG